MFTCFYATSEKLVHKKLSSGFEEGDRFYLRMENLPHGPYVFSVRFESIPLTIMVDPLYFNAEERVPKRNILKLQKFQILDLYNPSLSR